MISAYLLYIAIALLFAAFFSGSETAFTSIRFIKLVHLVEKKNKRALLVHRLLRRPDRLLATTLIGTNISVVVASTFATNLAMLGIHHYGYASVIATLCLAPLVLIFGEIIPKTIAHNKANRMCLAVAPFLFFTKKVLSPIMLVVSGITASLLKVLFPKEVKKNPFLTKDEIKLIIRDIAKEGVLEDYEQKVIDSIFDFTLTRAIDIMVPLKEIRFIPFGATRAEILQLSHKYGFTRFPVFEGKTLKGVFNMFDLFYHEPNRDWREYIRPLRTVSFDDRLDIVFSVVQPNKETMVGVLKNTEAIGILTVEDLIEEIVYHARVAPKEQKQITKIQGGHHEQKKT